jgi:hypothetical protein
MVMKLKGEIERGTRNPMYMTDDDWFHLRRVLPMS